MKDNKPWYEKLGIWIAIIAGICTILGIRVFDDFSLIRDKTNEQKIINEENNSQNNIVNDTYLPNNNKAKNYSNPNKSDKEIEYRGTENSDKDFKEQILIDVNAEVLDIRTKNNSLPEPKNLPEPTPNDPIYKHHDNNGLTMIKIASGYQDINYSRIYYYNEDGTLYFAFIFDNLKENRLYFKNNILIRYIDESGTTYDLNENLDTCEWNEYALKESYKIFND